MLSIIKIFFLLAINLPCWNRLLILGIQSIPLILNLIPLIVIIVDDFIWLILHIKNVRFQIFYCCLFMSILYRI